MQIKGEEVISGNIPQVSILIPTYNISMSDLIRRMHQSDVNWKLSLEEQLSLKLEWYRQIVKKSDALEKTLS